MAALPSALEVCRADLFASDTDLRAKYPARLAERVMRIREVYNHWMANPGMKDRELRDVITTRYGVSQSAAYADLGVLHQLAPLLAQKPREFHRMRVNEMLLETYGRARDEGNLKVMAQAAASYAKTNRVDLDDEQRVPYEDIVPQPFSATLDVRVLGIKPIPDLYNHIARLVKELSGDAAEILDVEYEEPDLEEPALFALPQP